MHSQEPGNDEAHPSDALIVKAIIPERVQHDVKEQIVIVFNHRLPAKSKSQFFVDFVGTAGAAQVSAKQLNSSTLILETPDYPVASVVTAYVYHGINRRLLGQHRFEFLSRTDTFYRLLYGELDPIKFMCESLSLSPTDVQCLDVALTETFKANSPEGFNLLGIHKNVEGRESSAEHPTLLHFASQFGLSRLITTLLHYPGAQEACSIKNYHGEWPYNIAENHGFQQLADNLRTFRDQGDPDQIYTDMDDEDCYYVKMQKDDGSYCYVPMNGEGHGLYVDMKGRKYINLDKQEDEDGYYVKMRNDDGSYYYVPMKGEGGSHSGKLYEDVKEKGKYLTPGYTESEQYESEEATYANYQAEVAADVQTEEFYEEMERNPQGQETSEDFYMDMEREQEEKDSSEFYTSMEPTAQSPEVPPGYVTPRSNLPVNRDPAFYRSASNAAAIRAKEIENERKTRSLPPPRGRMNAEILRSTLRQSGIYSSEEIDELVRRMETTDSVPPDVRRGSTSSRSSTSTTSSSSSGTSGISSGHEFTHHEELTEDVDQEEEIHLTRQQLFQKLDVKMPNSKTRDDDIQAEDAPPPLPQPDYEKEKVVGSTGRRNHPRSRLTAPVDRRDIEGLVNPAPPPVARRRSEPKVTGSSASDFHPKTSAKKTLPPHFERPAPPLPEGDFARPQKSPPPPVARAPMPPPINESSRPPPPLPTQQSPPPVAVRRPTGGIPLPGFPDTPPPPTPQRVPRPLPRGHQK